MTTAIWIWTAFHALGALGEALGKGGTKSTGIALTSISWMSGAALLWSKHTTWFIIFNAPLIAMMVMISLAYLGKPPHPDNEDKAQSIAWAAALRLFTTLTCWFLSV